MYMITNQYLVVKRQISTVKR